MSGSDGNPQPLPSDHPLAGHDTTEGLHAGNLDAMAEFLVYTDADEIRSALLVVTTDDGTETIPAMHADAEFEQCVWFGLAAHVAHIANAFDASPTEIAAHAVRVLRDQQTDDNGPEPMTDGGIDVPQLVSDEIGVGDVVVDLATGKSLQVLSTAMQSAGEHPQTRSDDTASMFGAEPDEPVYNCVFLPNGERVSAPSKTYAYPDSRLLRYPVEQAHDGGDTQSIMRTSVVEELVNAGLQIDDADALDGLQRLLVASAGPDAAGLVEEFRETLGVKQ